MDGDVGEFCQREEGVVDAVTDASTDDVQGDGKFVKCVEELLGMRAEDQVGIPQHLGEHIVGDVMVLEEFGLQDV